MNFHLGIPRPSGLRDDVQLLWSGSHLNNGSYGSINDLGPGYQQFYLNNYFAPYAAPICNQSITFPVGLTVNGCVPSSKGAYTPYADQIAYNVPFGTPIATPTHTSLPSIYSAPGTPQHQFDAPIPLFDEGLNSYQNDTGIVKLQYTHALSQAAYVRAYAYTFYSDWLQTAPLSGATGEAQPALPSPEYELITHTSGGALEFNDQINDQNLLGADVNYTQANVARFNNTSAIVGAGTSPIGYMSGNGQQLHVLRCAMHGGGKQCRAWPAATTTSLLGIVRKSQRRLQPALRELGRALPEQSGTGAVRLAQQRHRGSDRIRRPDKRFVGFVVDGQCNRLVQHRPTAFHECGNQRPMAAKRSNSTERLGTLRQLHVQLARFGLGRNAVLRQHDGQLHLRSGLDKSGLRHPARSWRTAAGDGPIHQRRL